MLQAGLQIEHSSFVRAWIEDDSAGESVEVTLLVDDVPHWSGFPRRLEHPRFDPDTPRTPCGIWVALPSPTACPQIVEVKLVKEDTILARATVDLSRRYAGFVDRIDL